MIAGLLGLALSLALGGCQSPGIPEKPGAETEDEANPQPVEIHLDYYSIVPPEERLLQSDWSSAMAAIESAGKEMRMQPYGKTAWQDGRAFPLFVGDGGEVSLLIQCIRRSATETWIQIAFFDGPERDRDGQLIVRTLPHGSLLCAEFWKALHHHL